MARESKRKCAEKRFGRPERLVDTLLDHPVNSWPVPPWFVQGAKIEDLTRWRELAVKLQGTIAEVPIFEISNVADYWFSIPGEHCSYRDFPQSVPPFPVCFVEFAIKFPDIEASRVGWLFICQDKDDEGSGLFDADHGDYAEFEDARWIVNAILCLKFTQKATHVGYREIFGITPDGTLCPNSCSACASSGVTQDWVEAFKSQFRPMVYPALFAFSLANCKNVETRVVEPDAAINRERRKGGIKPFVRYHTINIEPMKKVLRTEGQVETVGLKRAFHICRGHFATFTPERPLFGKIAGTFWMPPHVRGSVKEGVVVSDYRVNAPGVAK